MGPLLPEVRPPSAKKRRVTKVGRKRTERGLGKGRGGEREIGNEGEKERN